MKQYTLPIHKSKKVTLVDEDIYKKYKNERLLLNNQGYAYLASTNEFLHRKVMNLTKLSPIYVDHKNRDILNNTRDNLRLAYQSQNIANSKKRSNCSSPYKGVWVQNTKGGPKYKVVKVFLLALIDRTKCNIVDSVLRFGGVYSMGALNGVFQCSVCCGVLGPECQRTCTCYHSDFKDVRSYGGIYNGRLHYVSACNPIFGEISVLSESPADYSAVGDFIDMKLK